MPAARSVAETIATYSVPVPEAGCHLWLGGLDADGYGKMRQGLAHRYSYELAHGPIPAGLEIDHRCRVRCCVNPAHLRVVSHAANVARAVHIPERHRNGRKTHCRHGHEFTPENTIDASWRGQRRHRKCRTCRSKRNIRET